MDPFEKIRIPNNPNGSLQNFNNGFVDLDYGFPEEFRGKINKEELSFKVNTFKIIFRFVSSKSQFDKEFGLPRANPNNIYIYVEKPKDLKIFRHGNSFSDVGLKFSDIINFYGVSLGKNRVIKIENDTEKEINKLIDRIFKAMEIKKENHTYHYGLFSRMIHQFVTDYPSSNYEPPNALDKIFSLFSLCLQLGVIDINNGAEFISKEILQALANQIRKARMTEERWNPNIATIKYFSEENSGNKYDPLIPTFNDFNNQVKSFFSEHKKLNNLDTNKLLKSEYSTEKNALIFNISTLSSFVTNQIFEALEFVIADSLNNISTYLKANNALLVGLINGIIELVASIIEAIGFVVGLFNYDNIKKLTDSIGELIKNFELKKVFKAILKNIKELFQFLDDDIIYKNAYEFGLFIPKIIELIFDVIGFAKGVSKVAKSISEIITEMAKTLKKSKKIISDITNKIILKNIDKLTLTKLEKLGVKLKVKLQPILASNPLKAFDGKIFAIEYKGVVIKQSKSEKEINNFLKEIQNDNKLLDKLANIKLRKNALLKWTSKFENKFHLHFDGEIIPVLHNDGTFAYYKMAGAHNHEKIGDVFELIAIRKPPGMTFNNLPNDVPFKGNVEMIKNGVSYQKRATSTFFPKNWDITRVKEEIALVYEEMIKSGKTYHSRSTNRKFDFVNSEGTFIIRIEFDDLGNITNAYPLIN